MSKRFQILNLSQTELSVLIASVNYCGERAADDVSKQKFQGLEFKLAAQAVRQGFRLTRKELEG